MGWLGQFAAGHSANFLTLPSVFILSVDISHRFLLLMQYEYSLLIIHFFLNSKISHLRWRSYKTEPLVELFFFCIQSDGDAGEPSAFSANRHNNVTKLGREFFVDILTTFGTDLSDSFAPQTTLYNKKPSPTILGFYASVVKVPHSVFALLPLLKT